jgi:hypothetical protein
VVEVEEVVEVVTAIVVIIIITSITATPSPPRLRQSIDPCLNGTQAAAAIIHLLVTVMRMKALLPLRHHRIHVTPMTEGADVVALEADLTAVDMVVDTNNHKNNFFLLFWSLAAK